MKDAAPISPKNSDGAAFLRIIASSRLAIIHNNLDAAMEAANVTGSDVTLNRQAKSAARSAFESAKQRFFGHLLTSMKTPTLLRSITADLEAGHSAVIQIVSTGEALMERRLAELPTEEWNDVRVDITPREYVLSGAPDKHKYAASALC